MLFSHRGPLWENVFGEVKLTLGTGAGAENGVCHICSGGGERWRIRVSIARKIMNSNDSLKKGMEIYRLCVFTSLSMCVTRLTTSPITVLPAHMIYVCKVDGVPSSTDLTSDNKKKCYFS